MTITAPDRLTAADIRACIAPFRELFRRGRLRRSAAATLVANLASFESLGWELSVQGFAISTKRTDHRDTYELALRIYVRRKVAKSKLRSEMRVPEYLEIAREQERIRLKTDVVELREMPRAHRRVSAADSIGHFFGREGTLGCVVADAGGKRYAMTCCHVAALSGRAQENDPVESPSDPDGTAGPNTMGTLVDWTPLSTRAINSVDAALVSQARGIELSNDSLRLGTGAAFANYTLAQYLQLQNQVVSVEASSRQRIGRIEGIHEYLRFSYPEGVFAFGDLFSYSASTIGGDSGAAVVDFQTRTRVLGMHMAGEAGVGYAMTSRNILRAFRSYSLKLAA